MNNIKERRKILNTRRTDNILAVVSATDEYCIGENQAAPYRELQESIRIAV